LKISVATGVFLNSETDRNHFLSDQTSATDNAFLQTRIQEQ